MLLPIVGFLLAELLCVKYCEAHDTICRESLIYAACIDHLSKISLYSLDFPASERPYGYSHPTRILQEIAGRSNSVGTMSHVLVSFNALE